ncbi:hypothetical protein ABBQ32_002814 [Trebouxia sp. C0010 RCD-2024]
MDMAKTAAAPLAPGTIRHPTHGAFKGHLLPGCFFLIWGTYWLLSVFRLHFRSSEKKPFKSRAWYPFLWPKSVPIEPLLKVVFPFIGINGELWAGHDHYRHLYEPDGHFTEHHLQDWQHSAMYLAFLLAGLIDLMAYYTQLPAGIDQGALAMAYVIEGLLFSFHLRGDLLDVEIHTLLVITIFLTAIVIFAEIQHNSNVLLSALRPILVIMQGVWFVQAAFILFRDNYAWDPDYMGSSMMVPVLYVTWFMAVMFISLMVYLGMNLYYQKVKKTYRPLSTYTNNSKNTEAGPFTADLDSAEEV